jgi:hypothetical protein
MVSEKKKSGLKHQQRLKKFPEGKRKSKLLGLNLALTEMDYKHFQRVTT